MSDTSVIDMHNNYFIIYNKLMQINYFIKKKLFKWYSVPQSIKGLPIDITRSV